MNILKRILVVFAFILLFFKFLRAQEGNKFSLEHHFNHYGVLDGSPSELNNFPVFEDSYGFWWINSAAGLIRFDGQNTKVYLPVKNDTTSLISPLALSSEMFESSSGDLWFTNRKALICYSRESDDFKRYFPGGNDFEDGASYDFLYIERDFNTFYISINDCLYYGRLDSMEELTLVHCTFLGGKIVVTPDESVGFSIAKFYYGVPCVDLFYFNDGKLINDSIIKLCTVDDARISGIAFDSIDEFIVSTDSGLRRYNFLNKSWSGFSSTVQIIDTLNIISLTRQGTDYLLLGTKYSGIHVVNLKNNTREGVIRKVGADGRSEVFYPDASKLMCDEAGMLLVCTEEEGLFYGNLRKKKVNRHLMTSSLAYRSVGAIDERNGIVWALGRRGVSKMTPNDTIYYPLPIKGFDLESATFIHADNSGRIWVGTLEWLFVLRTGEDQFREIDILPESLPNRPGYNDICELESGEMILSTNDRGCFLISEDLKTSKWISPQDSTQGPYVVYFKDDILLQGLHNSQLLIQRRKGDKFILDTTLELSAIPTAIRYSFDSEHYFIATFDGLFSLSLTEGEWLLQQDNEIVIQSILSMELVSDSLLLVGTSQGLLVYNYKNGESRFLNPSDGVQGYNFRLKSSAISSGGKFFFGGVNGLNSFSTSDLSSKIPLSRPAIVGFELPGLKDNDNLPDELHTFLANPLSQHEVTLPYQLNNFSVRLASRSYTDPTNDEFAYELKGSTDESLRQLGKSNTINFSNLEVGIYELVVHSSNGDGIWSSSSNPLQITILPPWYRTWWAYTLYALTIFGVAFTIFWLRLMRIREKEKGQVREAKYQTEVAQAQAQAAKTETSVLRLQMNPHFIFNSLNAVNAFLWKGNKLEANEYLARFALLMRETLNRSTQTLSRLEDTIYSLENYLGTEQMRLGDKMSYKFEVDETLDTFSVYFPTMMLQPFVENAIWHGISGMEEQGLITIRFQADRGRGVLIADVEDNGRGRKQAANRNTGHASKSLGITQRRLDLLNMALNTAPETSTAPAPRRPENSNEESPSTGTGINPIAEMQIIDLLREDGSAAGTLVRLTLPLKYPKTYARDNS